MPFPNRFCQSYRSLKAQSAKGPFKVFQIHMKMILGWVWERILSYYMVMEHERENILLETLWRTFLETLDIFGTSTSFCFRVRRSSTWSARQMPTWLSLSAGAALLTRTRCSLGTRWTSAISVPWSKDRHFSFLQVFPGPLWEGFRRAGSRREVVAPEPAPSRGGLIWLCGISLSYQLITQNWTTEKFTWWPVDSMVTSWSYKWKGPGKGW